MIGHDWFILWDVLFFLGSFVLTFALTAGTTGVVKLSGDVSMLKVWIPAVIIEGLIWWRMFDPPWVIGAAVGVILLHTLLMWTFWPAVPRKKRPKPVKAGLEAGTGPWGLPDRVIDAVKALPDALPQSVEAAIDAGLEDYVHLSEALRAVTGDPPGVAALRVQALATLEEMLGFAERLSQLERLAAERPGDAGARGAVDKAMARLNSMVQGLEEAASAALSLVASEDGGGGQSLHTLAENLKLYSAAKNEVASKVGEKG